MSCKEKMPEDMKGEYIPCKSKTGKIFYRKTTEKEREAFKRQNQIKIMRENGLTFKDIGDKYSISSSRARQLYIKSQRDYI